jgi:hypothetical protein
MQIESVDIDSLAPDPRNAKKHGARSIAEIKNSLSRFGQQRPIVVDAAGVVRAGNGTLQAARELGWRFIDVVRSDLSPTELRAFAIADNRTAEWADWNLSELADALADPGVGDVGFEAGEFEKLTAALATSESAPDGPPPGAADPATAPEPTDSTPPKSGRSIKLTAEQREGVDDAFARFREKHGADGPPLSEGQIVTLIFADWVAGN